MGGAVSDPVARLLMLAVIGLLGGLVATCGLALSLGFRKLSLISFLLAVGLLVLLRWLVGELKRKPSAGRFRNRR